MHRQPLIDAGLTGVDFFAINTDVQALRKLKKQINPLQIGSGLTRGSRAPGMRIRTSDASRR